MPVSPRAGYAESQRVAFCATCKANTSSVSVCPFCGQDIDADGDQMFQTCQDRVAPLLVCHQCGEHREFAEQPALPPLAAFQRDLMRHFERHVAIPTTSEINP